MVAPAQALDYTAGMTDYHGLRRRALEQLSKSDLIDLIEDGAKNWLAHDGLWFLAAEKAYGMDAAIALDREAWARFTVIEAKRIIERCGIAPDSGLEGLKRALAYRLYAHLNVQELVDDGPRAFVFRMTDCRVQAARKRDGRADFPCKTVGLVEYGSFATTIDARIRTECMACPPDAHPEGWWCAWRFSLPA